MKKIALLGYGVVGKGVRDIIEKRDDMEVVRVLVRREIAEVAAISTTNIDDIVSDPAIDTVVEVMGGVHPAFEYISAALRAGKNVVTANKAVIAARYRELTALAAEHGVALRCTAAVGGGISWLSELERTRRTQTVEQVGGIMNGTCNYILDSMTRLGLGYDEALKQAQQLGYAEANPTTDVEGIDTWHKVILSANIGFGVSLIPETVPVCGISKITAADVKQFTARGLVCKLISTGKCKDGRISAYVQPTLTAHGEPEAAVPGNFNLITLHGSASGRMSFFGQGAGRYPTAHNVIQDCADVLAGKGFYSPYGEKVAAKNTDELCYYVSGETDVWLQERIQERWGHASVTKPVSVEAMHAWHKEHPNAFIAAIG